MVLSAPHKAWPDRIASGRKEIAVHIGAALPEVKFQNPFRHDVGKECHGKIQLIFQVLHRISGDTVYIPGGQQLAVNAVEHLRNLALLAGMSGLLFNPHGNSAAGDDHKQHDN